MKLIFPLYIKFGFISILYNSTIHNDLHAGNLFFYINDNNSLLPKYQLGLIDFGICCFPSKDNQNSYYYFFNEININKKFDNEDEMDKLLNVILEEKDKLINLKINNNEKYRNLTNDGINILKKYTNLPMSSDFLIELAVIFKKYNFNLSQEFNQICLGLKTVESIGQTLCSDFKKLEKECLQELTQINRLIEI